MGALPSHELLLQIRFLACFGALPVVLDEQVRSSRKHFFHDGRFTFAFGQLGFLDCYVPELVSWGFLPQFRLLNFDGHALIE